jgi:hypothetical protein
MPQVVKQEQLYLLMRRVDEKSKKIDKDEGIDGPNAVFTGCHPYRLL